MTGGFPGDWWVLLLFPVALWVPFGLFIMGTPGVWCASGPGRRPWLVPLEPVGSLVTHTMLPLGALDDPVQRHDCYGVTRVTRTLRARPGRV
ncbi:hypothetical protein ABZ208_02650 [Streptomyces sp. NPDC006208]|uniref:hypothetical protein n=1 Tax=Streptomyces sp. NPDC006208 TaxID=3156734 RepID=UPI0033B863DA